MKPKIRRQIGKNGVAHERRKRSCRSKIRELGSENPKLFRLTVDRSLNHIRAQIFTSDGACVRASASSLEKELREQRSNEKGKLGIAKKVGQLIAKRAKEAGILKVAFDRAGYPYHGRIKALAEAAREHGLEF